MQTLEHILLSADLQQMITTAQAWHYGIIPKSASGNKIEFYIDESKPVSAIYEELEMLLGKDILLEPVSSALLEQSLGKYYRRNQRKPDGGTRQIDAQSNEDFLQGIIAEAKQLGSSDIHIEAYEEKCRIRFRIDGMLIERYSINRTDYPALINKIKIRANLDIAEKRLPQDGRIFFNQDGAGRFDIRVSVLPTLHGEKVVLRLLSNDATDIDIQKLGFSEKELQDYLEGVRRPHGILLISGPTGSGKTTTLYATLKILNKEKTNILTIEDPIEYTLEGINQTQLKESIGLTFASALRTFLRQDPDVIMLGEIRDGETAQMAIRAALTGHLVLSTIHTNSAWGTVSRLTDMGVPPYLLANTLNTTVAQRLVRLLCPHCKEKSSFDAKFFPRNFRAPRPLAEHYTAKGCDACHYTGYKGRKAIYEVIPVDPELAEQIKSGNHNVSPLLQSRSIGTLSDNAFALFEKGETTIEEVYSILLNQS